MTDLRIDRLTLQRRPGFRLGPLSLHIRGDRRTALVGPSGSGKTTLLRLLAGLERADDGHLWFGDQLATDGRRLPLPPERRQIGFVFQDGGLWPHLDAAGHLRFCNPRLPASGITALLERVGLGGLEHRRPQQLSGGEQQRLALARALVGDARWLLLDEPLHSVDVHLRAELAALIRECADERGLGLVLVTHDRDEALALAEDLVVMRAGQVEASGPAAELRAAPPTPFCSAFLGTVAPRAGRLG